MNNYKTATLLALVSILYLSISFVPEISETELNFMSPEKISSGRYINEFEHNKSPTWASDRKLELEDQQTGTIEVNQYPNSAPTEEQWENAWELYNRTYENAERKGWFNVSRARSDGYNSWSRHHPNEKYIQNEENLNPERPEFLVYYNDSDNHGQKILAGAMYQTSNIEEKGLQIGGPLTVWHYHRRPEPTCYENSVYVQLLLNRSQCSGKMSIKGPEMIHVWFINHRKGQFATNMKLPEAPTEKPDKMTEKEFRTKMDKVLNR